MASVFALALLSAAPLAARAEAPEPGIWTNTEDQAFAEEEDRARPEWFGVRIGEDGRWQRIDPYGAAQGDWQTGPIAGVSPRPGGGWDINGSELRRARPFTCWMSVKKFAGKPDGSEDWSFQSGLKTFDQGGRVRVGGGDAPEAELRLRNVTWAKGSRNRPSLVLYIHRPGEDRAVSYGWASPDADLIGINLRWIQGSCNPDTAAPASVDAARLEEDAKATLVAHGARWSALYSAGDFQAMRALYEPDAWLMTEGAPAARGVDAILAHLAQSRSKLSDARFAFEPERIDVDGDTAYLISKYWLLRDGKPPVGGRSMLVYKRGPDGEWRIWRDIDNMAPDIGPPPEG